ncbi:MAG: glycosyltransferase family 2 protein [Bacteroidota bacterium]
MIYFCIPVYNRLAYTIRCIESILANGNRDIRIILADSGSTDGTIGTIRSKFPDVVILEATDSLWWTGATNLCVREALRSAGKGDFIFTLNNDTELAPGALEQLLKVAAIKPGAIIGAVNLFFTDHNKIEPSAFKRNDHSLFFKQYHYPVSKWGETIGKRTGLVPVDTLSGKGVLIPAAVFNRVGLYNEDELPHYHGDTEFVLRCRRAGVEVFLSYDSAIYSHQELSGSGTRTSNPGLKSFIRSFSDLKSANHLASNLNFCRLVFGKSWQIYFLYGLFRSVFGFFRRYVTGFLTKR